MNRIRLTGFLFTLAIASFARASDLVDNPKYHAWSKFKPGSSETLEADIQAQGMQFHIQTTLTLISASDDEVVVETVAIRNSKGQKADQSTKRETFKSRVKQEDLKKTGEKEIEAMGKTFKCSVYEAKGNPGSGASASGPESAKGTIYLCDDVPGGMVRLDAGGLDGKSNTFILTAMDAK